MNHSLERERAEPYSSTFPGPSSLFRPLLTKITSLPSLLPSLLSLYPLSLPPFIFFSTPASQKKEHLSRTHSFQLLTHFATSVVKPFEGDITVLTKCISITRGAVSYDCRDVSSARKRLLPYKQEERLPLVQTDDRSISKIGVLWWTFAR